MLEAEAIKFKCPLNKGFQSVGEVSMSKDEYCMGSECKIWASEATNAEKESIGNCSFVITGNETNFILMEIHQLLRDRLS